MLNQIAKITECKQKKIWRRKMAETPLSHCIDTQSTESHNLLHNMLHSISIQRSTFEPFLSVKNDDLGNYYQKSVKRNDWVDY